MLFHVIGEFGNVGRRQVVVDDQDIGYFRNQANRLEAFLRIERQALEQARADGQRAGPREQQPRPVGRRFGCDPSADIAIGPAMILDDEVAVQFLAELIGEEPRDVPLTEDEDRVAVFDDLPIRLAADRAGLLAPARPLPFSH